MRRFTTTILAIMAFVAFTFAQEDENYVMFENSRFVVKTDKYKEFGKAMAHHNKTYHSGDSPYHANVWSVSVGADAGHIVWSMGPCTFAQHDGRPSGSEHMEDWMFNVMPNIKYHDGTNMWKMDKDHSYNPKNVRSTKLSIRVYDLEDFQGYRFKEILSKVIEVYKEKEYEETLGTYWSQFDTEANEDVAIVWGFDKWAWFDKDSKFKADFEEVHGEGSWFKFLEELKGCIISAKDEVWELIPELSGGE